MNHFIDFGTAEKVPNKYNLKPTDIEKLKVVDWDLLKKYTWYNVAMEKSGEWYCHLEGCQKPTEKYNDEEEFWIGFNKTTGHTRYEFTAFGGMTGYNFREFYKAADIENDWDFWLQVNTLHYLNKLLDNKVVILVQLPTPKGDGFPRTDFYD